MTDVQQKDRDSAVFSTAQEFTQPDRQNLLQSSRFAAAVLVAVIVFGSLFGVRRSLNRAEEKITRQFYTISSDEPYGIATDLDKILEFSGNLITIANKYGSAYSDCVENAAEARLALSEAQGPAESYAANEKLTLAVQALNAAMADGNLSETDEQYRVQLYASIQSRNSIIAHEASDYNTQVREFNQTVLGSFLADILGPLLGVEKLEEYH